MANNLVLIGYVFTFIFIILIFLFRVFSTVSITLANIIALSAGFIILVFAILFLHAFITIKNPSFRIKYLSMLAVFFLTISASVLSFYSTPASIINVSNALVVATSISILIDIEFYKHMKEFILKQLKYPKAKRGPWWLIRIIDIIELIIETFSPMIASTLALFIALVVLMVPYSVLPFSLPFSILLIDISIFLVLFALVMPIELFAEDLFIQAQIIFEPSEEIK